MMVLLRLFTVFAKIGAIVFGGGMVMIPFIEREVVQHYGWLTAQEFADAVALGQITPGPVLMSATFIGYKVQGFTGAAVATVAIFLPSFFMTALATGQMTRLRRSRRVAGFLKGVLPVVIALLLTGAYSIAKASVGFEWPLLLVIIVALVLLVKYKLDVIYVVIGAGVIGYLVAR